MTIAVGVLIGVVLLLVALFVVKVYRDLPR